jgi:hypothetical protein
MRRSHHITGQTQANLTAAGRRLGWQGWAGRRTAAAGPAAVTRAAASNSQGA